jgi:aspartate/methionine/tyrosine aminotransferase
MLDALFCLTDPGDEVLLTDPTYAGMLNRVRLVGAVPRLVPLQVADGRGDSIWMRWRGRSQDAPGWCS